MDKPLVKNAASRNQVKKAVRKERDERAEQIADLKSVLRTAQGRRVMWRILTECKTFNSIWEQSAKIHYNAGRQDLGHWLMAEIVDTDENRLFEMMKEHKEKTGE